LILASFIRCIGKAVAYKDPNGVLYPSIEMENIQWATLIMFSRSDMATANLEL